ncbi:unnamed protein product [Umbelopsis vinacea]
MVNILDNEGRSPIDLATKNANLELAKLMLGEGSNVSKAPKFKKNTRILEHLTSPPSTLMARPNVKTKLSPSFFKPEYNERVSSKRILEQICIESIKEPQNTIKDRFHTDTIIPKYLLLTNIRHKYGNGFPTWRNLQLDSFPSIDADIQPYDKESDISMPAIVSLSAKYNRTKHAEFNENMSKPSFLGSFDKDTGPTLSESAEKGFSPIIGVSKDVWAVNVMTYLINQTDAVLYGNDEYFMLRLPGNNGGVSTTWASQFDKMKGIIREPGLLLVQIPQKRTELSISQWHNNEDPLLSFIDSINVCRKASCSVVSEEAFADILGGSEQRLSPQLRATLIAGLSIISITGGHQNVADLVNAILLAAPNSFKSISDSTSENNQVLNGTKCLCESTFTHRPLSPIAAAKAVGFSIWKDQEMGLVTRVWDLRQDKLVNNVDIGPVVFMTHRWIVPGKGDEELDGEILYSQVASKDVVKPYGISTKSKKLKNIRDVLLNEGAKYVWMDTICIDKSSLSELDEAIRSMYKWYANCRAVVLDSGTSLRTWIERGWCLQEGAAAGALYGIYQKKLISIQVLATVQKINLCNLDLSVYYRPGNAAEILAIMDRRKTTRKEDKTYALMGLFSIHMTLAYGEGEKARERLLHALATQKGDLSFLSFAAKPSNSNYLPTIDDAPYLAAQCRKASTPATHSHFGLIIQVQLVRMTDADKVLVSLKSLHNLKKFEKDFFGATKLMEMIKRLAINTSMSSYIAIVSDIRSIMLLEQHGEDRQPGGGASIKCCHRLQCYQIEELEFERLFGKMSEDYERIWLGDQNFD